MILFEVFDKRTIAGQDSIQELEIPQENNCSCVGQKVNLLIRGGPRPDGKFDDLQRVTVEDLHSSKSFITILTLLSAKEAVSQSA
jgi:hypothetical protein